MKIVFKVHCHDVWGKFVREFDCIESVDLFIKRTEIGTIEKIEKIELITWPNSTKCFGGDVLF